MIWNTIAGKETNEWKWRFGALEDIFKVILYNILCEKQKKVFYLNVNLSLLQKEMLVSALILAEEVLFLQEVKCQN